MSAVLKVPADSIDAKTSMDTVPAWDSLAHMNLVLAIEEEFKISIPDDEAANVTSYELLRVVAKELSAK